MGEPCVTRPRSGFNHAAWLVGSAFVTKPSAQRHIMVILKQPFVLSNWTGEM